MTDLTPDRQSAVEPNVARVTALAASLSPAQRNMVLDLGWADVPQPPVINRIVRRALLAAELMQPASRPSDGRYQLTPLGDAVRRHILEEQRSC
ncbi:hypothetical protein KZ810_02835 [Sphingomonas sp. RHCKR47]|uniref:hypothetical protein n=1 Tax=Sphingomonas citricola TaxID=2862498 RepID=UPI001CA4A43B|nr:hypothetical protein [Sphingomonas citricola]MBW6522423.1 hypothetical protein [Sphingomonas citricola]